MAFPGDYSKYQEVTIDNTKVSADLTDFPVYVDLSDLDKAGSDIFDTCRSDGGDIRVTKSDGTTELAREVVAIDTTAKTGELHIKYTGTLSSSADTTIRIWYNGTDTEPATTATYGRNNTWSNYRAVFHFSDDPSGTAPQLTDSTGNGNDMSSQGSMVSGDLVAGLFPGDDGAWEFAADTQYAKGDAGELQMDAADTQSWSGWIQKSNASGYWFWMHFDTERGSDQMRHDAAGGDQVFDLDGSGGGRLKVRAGVGTFDNTDAQHYALSYDGSATPGGILWTKDGSAISPSTINNNLGTGESTSNAADSPQINARATLASQHTLTFSEWRQSAGELSEDFITTEYNNQNSPSTFYSTGGEQTSGGGGGTVTPTPNLNLMGVG